MEVAIESEEWAYFLEMTVTTFADMLRTWAAKVNLKRFLKSPRGKKKPQKKVEVHGVAKAENRC